VLLYANARVQGGNFVGIRCCSFPHPDDLHPELAEVGALTDQSVESRGLNLTPEQRREMYWELQDFFENSPVSLHIVGGDGLVKYANKAELAAMGYDREAYIGEHIARFHADKVVIDGMLEDLVEGTPLVNFSATLFRRDGSKLPVMIYSNSRMRNGSFVNTRCFTVEAPKARKGPVSQAAEFTWPRNEDFGFTIPGRERPAFTVKPNSITLALKYIASRKRPEESLGFLARISQVFASSRPFPEMIRDVAGLGVPYLADLVSVDLSSGHLAHAVTPALQGVADNIVRYLANGPEFSVESVQRAGDVQQYNMGGEQPALRARAEQLMEMGIRSLIMAPLTIRGKHVGALALLRQNVPSRREFGSADRALTEELARRISFAIEIEKLSGGLN
jgi:PAS domain S-box-containing protein